MPDTSGNNVLKAGSKASKSELDWVRKRAEKAEKELDREQTNTVITIARALEDIAETESRAELDTRLAMVEEQLERLLERRDEVDQATQAELSVMRARIEEALEAMGAASESQRLAWMAMEERLSAIGVSRFDNETSPGGDDAEQIEVLQASPAPRKAQKALEEVVDDFQQRARKSKRQLLDDVEATLERWRSEVAAVMQNLQDQISGARKAQQEAAKKSAARMEARAKSVFEALEARAAEIEDRFEHLEGSIPETVSRQEVGRPGGKASVDKESRLIEILQEEAESQESMEESVAEAESAATRELLSVELDEKISEAKNDIRLELFEVRTALETSLKGLTDLVDWSHKDCLAGIRVAEEKAAKAAVYLESMISDHRDQLDQDRREWSGMLRLIAGDLAELQVMMGDMKQGRGADR